MELIFCLISSKTAFSKKVMTSDIEHNSPFLSTMTFAKRHQIPREVMEREDDGSIDLDRYDFTKALVVVNCASNIDGRKLGNVKELVKKVHKQKGVIIIDAAQALAHSPEILYKTEADAICSSAHKMYGPSLGVMIVRRDLFKKIETQLYWWRHGRRRRQGKLQIIRRIAESCVY